MFLVKLIFLIKRYFYLSWSGVILNDETLEASPFLEKKQRCLLPQLKFNAVLWCWRRLFESPLDCKEIQPVHPRGNQSWVFIGRTDAEAETPILWSPDAKSWLLWKNPDAGKDWGQEEKGMTEDEMVGWHHWLNGHGFGWTPGVGDGQGGLACCSSWGRKESDMTEWLNWTEGSSQAIKCETEIRVIAIR